MLVTPHLHMPLICIGSSLYTKTQITADFVVELGVEGRKVLRLRCVEMRLFTFDDVDSTSVVRP
jgi:hypothetical protein